MTFSVAIPTRNGSRYLSQAIRSALSQTRKPDEILVVDDNSTDDTAAIAASSEWLGSVKYFHNAVPTGFADAWNRAVHKACGDYVVLLHQDDLLAPEYLSGIETGLKKFPQAQHAFALCDYIDGAGEVLRGSSSGTTGETLLLSGKDYARRYLLGVCSGKHLHRCPGVATSRSLIIEQCCYRREAGHIADDDFFYRVGAFTDVVGVFRTMASYREHNCSATSQAHFLPLVLARDYLFQIQQRNLRTSIFDEVEEMLFQRIAGRMLNEALFRAFQSNQLSFCQDALVLAAEFQRLTKGQLRHHLPMWSLPMWLLAGGGWLRTANAYVRVASGLKASLGKVIRAKQG